MSLYATPDLVRQLQEAGVPDPQRDLRVLFRAAYERGGDSGPQSEDAPNGATRTLFAQYVAQRRDRMPVSQIVGSRAFWRHDFIVTPDVLDPRPDTETLVAAGLEAPFARVLDLGTGSGCVLLSLLADQPGATGLGVDRSSAALDVARRNAQALDLTSRAAWAQGDWLAPVEGQFDLIVSNPPYIPAADIAYLQPEVREFEPHMALTDEGDGLGAYRVIFAKAATYLLPGGRVAVEFGLGQEDDVGSTARAAGWSDISLRDDLTGRARVLVAKSPV
ncbi:MAG: peptide chain release factor N(5)-glutamine methyltransferase [Pseudomonadota bacterium]